MSLSYWVKDDSNSVFGMFIVLFVLLHERCENEYRKSQWRMYAVKRWGSGECNKAITEKLMEAARERKMSELFRMKDFQCRTRSVFTRSHTVVQMLQWCMCVGFLWNKMMWSKNRHFWTWHLCIITWHAIMKLSKDEIDTIKMMKSKYKWYMWCHVHKPWVMRIAASFPLNSITRVWHSLDLLSIKSSSS